MKQEIVNVLVTGITVLGSAGAWRFFEAKIKLRAQQRSEEAENDAGVLYRDDLKERIRNLETFLIEAHAENKRLQQTVLNLTEQVAEMRIKVEFLERENDRLKSK